MKTPSKVKLPKEFAAFAKSFQLPAKALARKILRNFAKNNHRTLIFERSESASEQQSSAAEL
jgi:hypothetical protein